MRRLTFFLVCMIICGQALSQDRRRFVVLMPVNKQFPVYHSPIGTEVNYRIMQDSIYEVFFNAEVLEESPLRYKVNITLATDSTGVYPKMIGWVDKNICGVYSRCYYDVNKRPYIKLYARADANADFVKVYESGDPVLLTAIDYAEGRWFKVMFYLNDELHGGWVDKYGDNVYNYYEVGGGTNLYYS